MELTMDHILTSLKNYWFLIIALVSLSGAWAQSQVKIQSLEEAVKQNITTQQEVTKLTSQFERFDERTKFLQESQIRQERMIEMLLQNQRSIIKQTK
jgi:hypothetical protein